MMAQDTDKEIQVKIKELQGVFKGKSKKNLAHGHGIAQGTDTYEGNFRKGFPNGNGKYIWHTGEIYDGKWVMGKKEGYGKYYFKNENGEDSFIAGYWKDDIYLGKNVKSSDYIIERKRNIDKLSINKRGGGNTIHIKYQRGGGNALYKINDLKYIHSSGNEITAANISGFENIEYPFTFKLDFTAPSKFKVENPWSETTDGTEIKREAEICINSPGYWVVTVNF